VGQSLAATPGGWSRSGLAFGYAWLRNGTPVPGADGPTYPLTSADAGAAVSVRVTARQDGYEAGTATSASTVVATGGAAATTSVPRVAGRAAAGQRLVADPGTWAGSGWSFHYQWLRNGSPVTGASGAAYVPSAADVGALLSVRVTATQPGYDAGTATSAAVTVDRFVSTTSVKLAKAKVSTARHAKVRVIVAAPGASGPTGKVRVVQRGHVVRTLSLVAGDRGSAATRLPRLDPGRYRIRADYAGTRTVAPSRSSTVVLRVR